MRQLLKPLRDPGWVRLRSALLPLLALALLLGVSEGLARLGVISLPMSSYLLGAFGVLFAPMLMCEKTVVAQAISVIGGTLGVSLLMCAYMLWIPSGGVVQQIPLWGTAFLSFALGAYSLAVSRACMVATIFLLVAQLVMGGSDSPVLAVVLVVPGAALLFVLRVLVWPEHAGRLFEQSVRYTIEEAALFLREVVWSFERPAEREAMMARASDGLERVRQTWDECLAALERLSHTRSEEMEREDECSGALREVLRGVIHLVDVAAGAGECAPGVADAVFESLRDVARALSVRLESLSGEAGASAASVEEAYERAQAALRAYLAGVGEPPDAQAVRGTGLVVHLLVLAMDLNGRIERLRSCLGALAVRDAS